MRKFSIKDFSSKKGIHEHSFDMSFTKTFLSISCHLHGAGQIGVLGWTLNSMLKLIYIRSVSYDSINLLSGMTLYDKILPQRYLLRKENKVYLKYLILC